MRIAGSVLAAALLAGAYLAGARGGESPRPVREARPGIPDATPTTEEGPAPPPAPPAPSFDLRRRMAGFENSDVAKLEEEMEARLVEDPRFAEELFAAFQEENDPVRMSFLQNVIASDARLRNSPHWQDRFVAAAEGAARRERRITALLFVQQAEGISTVRARMLELAEHGGELRPYALVALKGLPDRRADDPHLVALARKLADDPDPEVRGLAIRLGDDPARAAAALSDPDRAVRMHACHVASRAALEKALAAEPDDEIRQLIRFRLESRP